MSEHYKPIDAPALDAADLRKGLQVQTREFYACSAPGNRWTVVTWRQMPHRTEVRLKSRPNLGGQCVFKWIPTSVLALV
jgi:hypothetical protein